jgi:hypothetical protein
VGEPFELTITDVFQIRGRGTVVTGRVARGTVRVGDAIDVHPAGGAVRVGRIDGIERFREVLDEANAGDNVGLLLSGDAAEGVRAGEIVTSRDAPSRTTDGSSPGRPPASASRGQHRDSRFDRVEAEYRRLRDDLERGAIGPKDLDVALDRAVFELGGRYWMIGANSGRWYGSEGGRWVEAEPPAERQGGDGD